MTYPWCQTNGDRAPLGQQSADRIPGPAGTKERPVGDKPSGLSKGGRGMQVRC